MSDAVVFAVVFAVAGAFYVVLRRLGRRRPPGPAAEAKHSGDELAENLTFVADMADRMGRRRADRTDDPGSDGGGGGDGGGS